MKQETFANYRKRQKGDGTPIKSITQPAEGSSQDTSNKRIADIWRKTASMSPEEYSATIKTDSPTIRKVLDDKHSQTEKSKWENLDTVKKK